MNEKENVIYEITEEEIQGIAEEELERSLTEEEVGLFRDILNEKMIWVIQETVDEACEYSDLLDRRINDSSDQTRYDIYARNPNAFMHEFSLICSYVDEADAREYTKRNYRFEADEYKIEKVEKNQRSLILHCRNEDFHSGVKGFRMDVHDEPKSAQKHHDLKF